MYIITRYSNIQIESVLRERYANPRVNMIVVRTIYEILLRMNGPDVMVQLKGEKVCDAKKHKIVKVMFLAMTFGLVTHQYSLPK